MGFNVDWLNMVQEFPQGLYPDFFGGRVVSVQGASGLHRLPVVDDSGELIEAWTLSDVDEVDYNVSKFAAHKGSYETNLLIRMEHGRLEVRGNPSSYGRLDNIFGVGLDRAVELYNEVLESLGLPSFTVGEEKRLWLQNEQKFVTEYTGARITRVDWCQNMAVGMGNVRHFHEWLARQKLYRSSAQDRDLEKFAQWDFSTVYLSMSKYWMNVKVYDKGKNIEDVLLPEYRRKLKASERAGLITKPQLELMYNEAEEYLNRLACWCAEVGLSRVEYSLKSRWFAQNEGSGYWEPLETENQLLDVIESEFQKIGKRAVVYQVDAMSNLTDREHRLLDSWKKGLEVRDMVSRSAFYRFKASILEKTGYDIAARPVGLVNSVEFRPVYFQPKALTFADVPSWYRRAA